MSIAEAIVIGILLILTAPIWLPLGYLLCLAVLGLIIAILGGVIAGALFLCAAVISLWQKAFGGAA